MCLIGVNAMKVEIMHRDTKNVSRLFDYLHIDYSSRDKKNRKYYIRKTQALISLVQCVVNNELTDKQRTVFKLVFVQGLSPEQTSKKLDVNSSTVSRHLKAIQAHMDRAYQHFKSVEHYLIQED